MKVLFISLHSILLLIAGISIGYFIGDSHEKKMYKTAMAQASKSKRQSYLAELSKQEAKRGGSLKKEKKLHISSLEQIYNSEESTFFNRYGVGLNSIHFEKQKCHFFFSPPCIYQFRTEWKCGELKVLWDYKVDCFEHDLKHILKKTGIPKKNQVIGVFQIASDSTLLYEPYGKDYIGAINKVINESDTLYPYIFIL